MRRQGQEINSARTGTTETAPVQPQEADGGVKSADGENDLWSNFANNFWGADEETVQQPSEETTTPFLKPGMNVSVEISAASKQGVLLIPNEAILSFRDRKMVRVIGEDGLPGRPQPITTGISSFDKTEVISGAEEGQIIAIGGSLRAGGDNSPWRQMMRNPASTMRRMQGGPGGRR